MYWIIIEMLREQTDYKLRLDRINAIAMQTQCEKNKTLEFINDCILHFDLLDSDENFFWSNSLLNRMKAYDEKSEKAKISAQARWNKPHDANALQTQSDSNANQIKSNQIKSNQKRSNIKDTRYSDDENLNKALIEFAEFRKKIKKPMTDRAIELIMKKLNEMTINPFEQVEILNQSITNGWTGVYELKNKRCDGSTDNPFVKILERGDY